MNFPTKPFKVGDWIVEPDLLRISKNGDARKLEYKTMEILLYLVHSQGEVVSKKELHDEVWADVYVTDNALTRAISRLRKAFDDDPVNPQYIDTISKSGYRLVAPVELEIGARRAMPIQAASVGKYWIWVLAVILVVGGLGLVGIMSRAEFSGFYDPIPVSTLIGPEMGHAISPDGKKMSFTYMDPGSNNSNVYVKLLDDLSQSKFTDLNSHQAYGIWSPDGNHMAYASVEDGTCGIYKVSIFGGDKVRIGDCYRSPEDFVWSPDGRTIAFTDYKPPHQQRRIIFIDIETLKTTFASNPAANVGDRDPAFTPDNKHLIFRRVVNNKGGDIYKLQFSDSSITRLTFDNARILGHDVFDDGQQIAFSSNRGGPWALWKLPVAGGEISRIYLNDRVPTEPRFSLDGKRMVYRSLRDQVRLWAMEKTDSGYSTLGIISSSTRADMQPCLSTDGNKLVFISNRSGNFEIWANDLRENNPTKLTSLSGSFVNMPSWSPGGQEVVYDARIEGDNAIYVLDIASKMSRTFIDLEGDQVNARYSRDGKFIYFASDHSGSWQIWKMPVFGSEKDLIQITNNGGYHLQEGPNQELYFSRADTVGIWRISGNGREEMFIGTSGELDWGSWAVLNSGIIYLDRSNGRSFHHQPFNKLDPPMLIATPAKPIQVANPTITATADGSKVIMSQIENSEDELMMVDFL